jgi:hypothetical protein
MKVPHHPASSNSSATESTSLLRFPCDFPIKVMGHNVPALLTEISAVAAQFDPDFKSSHIELRHSKAGNYLGITLPIRAISQTQLDSLYRALSSHPLVKMVL